MPASTLPPGNTSYNYIKLFTFIFIFISLALSKLTRGEDLYCASYKPLIKSK